MIAIVVVIYRSCGGTIVILVVKVARVPVIVIGGSGGCGDSGGDSDGDNNGDVMVIITGI